MNKTCKGCGVTLQAEQPDTIGYTPNMDKDYCKRCFRITHYDDVVISMKQGIDPAVVLDQIAVMEALIVWVVDLFDFEANLIAGINRRLRNKDVLLVATKRDLLPATLGNEKLSQFIMQRLKSNDLSVNGIVICGDLMRHAKADDNGSIEAIKAGIAHYRDGRDVVIVGMANAGKSTLLNALLANQQLTTSRHPGTTLDFNAIPMDDYLMYDTPGLTRDDSLLTHVDESSLKMVIPQSALKARVYQLRDSQTISIGGYVRLDLMDCNEVSCVAYFSDRLPIHRSKQSNADTLWETHLQVLLAPSLNDDFKDMKKYDFAKTQAKMDIVIHGLGWFCINGQVSNIRVFVHKDVNVTCRKAML